MVLFVALFLAPLSAGPYAEPALAHTTLVSSVPARGSALAEPPTRLELVFGADLNAQFVSVALTHSGVQVPVGTPSVAGARVTADVAGDMPADAYKMAYKVVGDDGHVMTGEIGFRITGAGGAAGPRAGSGVGGAAGGGGGASGGGSGGSGGSGGVVGPILVVAVLGLLGVGFVMARDAARRRRL